MVSTIFVLVKSVKDVFETLSSSPFVAKPLHLHEGHCCGKHLLGEPPHLNWRQLSILEEKNWQSESLWSGSRGQERLFYLYYKQKTFLVLK